MSKMEIIDIVSEKWEDDVVVAEEKAKKPFELFTIMDALFQDKSKIWDLTDETCRQYLFMVLRRIAIKYPLQANHFNDGKSNATDVIRFWSDYLHTGTMSPRWTKTSGSKKEAKSKSNSADLTKDELKLYKKHYNITDSMFDDMMRFFPDDTANEMKEFKKYLKQKETKDNG